MPGGGGGGGGVAEAPVRGIGGGGGALVPGIGGGGGGGAPVKGIGGGGGGAVVGGPSSLPSKLPGIGGAAAEEAGACVEVVGLVGESAAPFSSIAESGRGGAMLPKSIDASCFALPPVTFSGPSSSSDEEVESTTDHSSSSCLRRDIGPPVGVDVRGGKGCDLATSCC